MYVIRTIITVLLLNKMVTNWRMNELQYMFSTWIQTVSFIFYYIRIWLKKNERMCLTETTCTSRMRGALLFCCCCFSYEVLLAMRSIEACIVEVILCLLLIKVIRFEILWPTAVSPLVDERLKGRCGIWKSNLVQGRIVILLSDTDKPTIASIGAILYYLNHTWGWFGLYWWCLRGN